jgi:hypothetical protein
MALTKASVLHYWSARFGAIPIIGGNPVHTRASTAKWIDQMGIVRQAPVNTPRFDWATVDGERRPVMRLEQARQNGELNSEDFSNGTWTKGNATISANAAIAPDGTLTADKLVEDSSAGAAHSAYQQVGGTASTNQTISVFAKAAGRDWIALALIRRDGGEVYSYFQLTGAGAFGASTPGIGKGFEAIGNGWFRCWITADSATGGTTPGLRVYLADSGANVVFNGGGTAGVYLWGAQYEIDKHSVSSYVPTTSAGVTRAADSFYWDYTPLPQAKMVYSRHVLRESAASGAAAQVWRIGSAASSAILQLYSNGGGSFTVYHDPGSGNVNSSVGVGAAAIGDTIELVVILSATGTVKVIYSLNGAAVAASATSGAAALAAAWVEQKLWLNSVAASQVSQGGYTEAKVVKHADVVAVTDQGIMDELRAFELAPSGEVVS